MTSIVIVGTGGMGREALAWLQQAGRGAEVVGFLDDGPERTDDAVADLPVLGPTDLLSAPVGPWGSVAPEVVVAVGSPHNRRRLLDQLVAWKVPLATVVHPTATIGPRTTIAAGAIVCPRVVLTCDVEVGSGAILNYGAMIGHDGSIGEAAFIAPGVNLAGNVVVGSCAYVGIGASVIQGCTIGEGAVVGAGASVIRDVAAGTTVVGVPARPIVKAGE